MITDFLHKFGDVEKDFVSEKEWWVVSGSVKVQIFLTNLEDSAELVVAANLFQYSDQSTNINEYELKLKCKHVNGGTEAFKVVRLFHTMIFFVMIFTCYFDRSRFDV